MVTVIFKDKDNNILGNGVLIEDPKLNYFTTYFIFKRAIIYNPYLVSRHPLNNINNCPDPTLIVKNIGLPTESNNRSTSITHIGITKVKDGNKLSFIEVPFMTRKIELSNGIIIEFNPLDYPDRILLISKKLLVLKEGSNNINNLINSLPHKVDWYLTDLDNRISDFNYFTEDYLGNDSRENLGDHVIDRRTGIRYSLTSTKPGNYTNELITYYGQVRIKDNIKYKCIVIISYASDFDLSKEFIRC